MGESAAMRPSGGPPGRRRQGIAKDARDGGGPQAGSDGALEQEVNRLHRLGVEAMSGGLPADAARRHRAALRLLDWPLHGPQPAAARPQAARLAGSLLISLAHAEAEQGRTALGLSLLDRAELLVRDADRGRLHGQRGLLLLRTGNSAAALESLDSAVALLAAHDDRRELARALLNRATCAFEVGRVSSARADLERCGELARDLGWPLMEAKALHNFGYCQFLRGDIPAALGIMAKAAARYAQCDPGILPILMVDKARALLAAGLADDARTELDGAIALFRDQRLRQDQAEAELLRAQAALLAGDQADARVWARRAQQRFERRGNATAAAEAELAVLHAQSAAGTAPSRVAARAAGLAARLRECGRPRQAETADLIRIRALISCGRTADARRETAALPRPRPGAALESRLLRQLTLAELDGLDPGAARPGPALRRLRKGLNLLQEHRAALGSLDLQTGSSALGVELAGRGLALALADGAPGLVLAWSERSRGQTQLLRGVLAPDDAEAAEALARMRQLDQAVRRARDAGVPPAPGLAQQRSRLERELRERSWQALGSRGGGGAERGAADRSARIATFTEVVSELASIGQTMVGFIGSGGALYALVAGNGRPRLVGLGAQAAVAETVRRLSADVDVLVGRLLPSRIEAVIAASVRTHAARLAEQLFTPLQLSHDDRDLVIVPSGELSAVPWNLLPGLRGRPITVASSASDWLAARQAAAAGPARTEAGPLLLAAPGPRSAVAEIDAIAVHYPRHLRLTGRDATVEAALRALDGAPIAHLAAHGHHQSQNVLFSSLELADGRLMAYDLLRLRRPPRHVVLSACEVGRSLVRPGGELLGFATTLLRMGTATVIAATTAVNESDATETMTAYHRELHQGTPPARALAAATEKVACASFICLGIG